MDAEVEQIDVDDYNGDGAADILALLLVDAEYPDSPFRLLSVDPVSGEYPVSDTPPTASATLLESASFAAGDLDDDGMLDLVLATETDGEILVFSAPTVGVHFPDESPQGFATVPAPTEVLLADIDRDAVLDVVIASGNELRVLLSGLPAAPPPPPPVDEPDVFEFSMSTVEATQGDTGLHSLITLDNSAEISGAVVLVSYDPAVVVNPTFDETGTVLDGAEFANESLDEVNSLISYHTILDMFPPFDGPVVLPGSDQELLRLRFDVAPDAPLGESTLGLPLSGGLPLATSSVFVDAEEVVPTRVPGTILVDSAPPPPPEESPDLLRIDTVAAAAGSTVFVPIYASSERAIEAFTVVATYAVDALDAVDLTLEGSASFDLTPEMLVPSIVEEEGYFTLSIIFDLLPPFEGNILPAGDDHILFRAEMRVHADAPTGIHPIALTDGLGIPPLDNIFSNGGMTYFPSFEHGGVIVRKDVGPQFIRGDVNVDALINATDSVFLLNWVFRDGETPPCMDAADVNDDGVVNVTDSTWILDYVLYGKEEPPPAPFPGAGVDPTEDGLDCETSLGS